MGLHIYSGSLVRYFTNDWENEIQRNARENGIEYRMHYPDGEPSWPTRKAATEHVAWIKSTLVSTPDIGPDAVSWNDEVDQYHTVKLHDEAREALAIVAAHRRRPDLPLPVKMPAIAGDDPAYAEAGPRDYLLDSIAPLEASLIVPGTFTRLSLMEDPLGSKRLTCSTGRLRTALAEVEQYFWRGGVQPAEWLRRGLVFARNASSSRQIDGQWVEERDEEPADSLRGNAEFAFGVFTSMLDFSDRHKTAIVTSW
jgi:hypothetical protein